jgi:hypothetical protein
LTLDSTSARSRSPRGALGPRVAFLFSLVGLVLCFCLFVSTLAWLLPESRLATALARPALGWLAQLLLHARHDRFRLGAEVSVLQVAALAMSAIGAVVGAILARSGRGDASSRDAVRAIYLGSAGLLAYAVASLAFCIGWVTMSRYGPSFLPFIIPVALAALAAAEYALFRHYRHRSPPAHATAQLTSAST